MTTDSGNGDGNADDESHDHGPNGASQPTEAFELQMPSREPPPPEIAELAASCVRFVLAKYKVPLDFSSDTLGILDHYVKEARADIGTRPEGQALLETSIGAYFGEVVRGLFESSWKVEGEYPEWRLSMSEVYLTFNPLGMAREALIQDEAPSWHSHLGMHAAEKEDVERRLAALPEVREDEYYALTTRFDVIELAVEALRARSRQP